MTQDSEGWCEIEGAMNDRMWKQFLCNQQFILFGDGQWGTMGKEQQSRWMMILIGVDSCRCWQVTLDNEGLLFIRERNKWGDELRWLLLAPMVWENDFHSFQSKVNFLIKFIHFLLVWKINQMLENLEETNGLKLYFCET